MISKFQYITGGGSNEEILLRIRDHCRSGGQWVQLRVKNRPFKQLLELATQSRSICSHYNAKLMINDHPDIARAVNAFGVHLGKNDMSATQAREVLFEHQIIGSTCNTWEDIERIIDEGKSDYIGLGPFRFTETKEKLSPVLGLEGVASILEKYNSLGYTLPIVAIGGIEEGDIEALYSKGVHGIAVSKLVERTRDLNGFMERIEKYIEQELDHAKFEISW